jgi:hypothetical protein
MQCLTLPMGNPIQNPQQLMNRSLWHACMQQQHWC